MKKLLALILALSLVLGSMSFVFAAAPADVKGDASEGAALRLGAFGVMKGFPDGSFKPGNTITRAEFAAIVVRLNGLEAAAKTQVPTKFSDVPATHWASGYISIASGMGWIKGMPDGTFAPAAPVTYEQAVTMIIRALGLETVANKLGGYPAGYIVRATQLGILKGLDGVVGTPATRGLVARLVDATITKKIWVMDTVSSSGGETYKEGTETFLDKMGVNSIDNEIVTETPAISGLAANKFKTNGTERTMVEGAFDLESLLGKRVKLWLVDGKVVLAEAKSSKEITATSFVSTAAGIKVSVKVGDDTKTYDVVTEAAAVLNQKASSTDNAFVALSGVTTKERYELKLTLDGDDKVTFVSVMKFDDPVKFKEIVENAVAKTIKIDAGSGVYVKYDNTPKKLVVVKDGQTVDYTALKKDDILMIAVNGQTNSADNIKNAYIYIKATSKAVEGKLDAVKGSVTTPTSFRVGGTFYDMSAFMANTDVSSLMDKDVKLTFDPTGKVYSIQGKTAAAQAPYLYGIAMTVSKVQTIEGTDIKIKMFTAEGKEVIYSLINNSTTTTTAALATPAGALVDIYQLAKYKVNSDGKIDWIETFANGNTAIVVDKDRQRITTPSTLYAKSDVVVFGEKDANKFEIVKFTDLNANATQAAIVTDGSDIIALKLTLSGYSKYSAVSEAKYAYVSDNIIAVNNGYNADIWTLDGKVNKTTSSSTPALTKGTVVKFTESDGKITVTTAGIAVTGTAASVDSAKIKVGSNFYYFTSKSLILYGQNGANVEMLTKANLYKDMEVEIYKDSNDDILALIVTKK